jgi:DeoR/GlpR family transcriptional regulator of sugar metabolism
MAAKNPTSVWLQVERRLKVLELLREQRTLKSAELADRFGVNIATIRRDFQALAEESGIRLIHGGATMITAGGGSVLDEIDLATKQVTNLEAKRTIARKAAALIADGDTIALNAGSTVELVLDYLGPTIRSISVLTLGLNIAWRAAPMPAISLYLAGGHYRRSSQALVGTAAANALRGVHVDKAFMGANAVDVEAGWTHQSDSELETNQLLLRNARRRYLLADSSKFGRVAFSQVSPLTEFDAFVVDDEFPQTYREWAEAKGIEII